MEQPRVSFSVIWYTLNEFWRRQWHRTRWFGSNARWSIWNKWWKRCGSCGVKCHGQTRLEQEGDGEVWFMVYCELQTGDYSTLRSAVGRMLASVEEERRVASGSVDSVVVGKL